MRGKKKKVVKTTILLPPEVHRALRIEAIEKKVSMGELIVQKLKELEEYKEKYGGVVKGSDLFPL
ncbi:chromosome segregation protein SMC [Thermocrinis sp.]